MGIFEKKILSWGIHYVDSVNPVFTQSSPELFCQRTFKHRLRVLVESRMSVEDQENGQKNNSETNVAKVLS